MERSNSSSDDTLRRGRRIWKKRFRYRSRYNGGTRRPLFGHFAHPFSRRARALRQRDKFRNSRRRRSLFARFRRGVNIMRDRRGRIFALLLFRVSFFPYPFRARIDQGRARHQVSRTPRHPPYISYDENRRHVLYSPSPYGRAPSVCRSRRFENRRGARVIFRTASFREIRSDRRRRRQREPTRRLTTTTII